MAVSSYTTAVAKTDRIYIERFCANLGHHMPSDPSSLKKNCLAKARECRRAAELANDPDQKMRWMEIEADWFFLARSYDKEIRASVSTQPNQHETISWPSLWMLLLILAASGLVSVAGIFFLFKLVNKILA
jgi:hypothetical protein